MTDLALDTGDLALETVVLHDLLGLVDNVGHVHGVDMLSTGLEEMRR